MLCSFTCFCMRLCIFNPEHDLCLAKGRWNYVPPRSAVDFARRDADIMSVLYPGAVCTSVYAMLPWHGNMPDSVTAWGWDAVVKHELLKRGISAELLPSDEEIATIRELQHRSTVLPLQPDCHEVRSIEEMESLLRECEHWVMKAPWSGAGRGLRWVHGSLTPIDRDWLLKTVATQRCIIAEPRRDVVADLALEYRVSRSSPGTGEVPKGRRGETKTGEQYPLPPSGYSPLTGGDRGGVAGSSPGTGDKHEVRWTSAKCDGGVEFLGYSYFKTGSGVYKENMPWTDTQIEAAFPVREARERIEPWLDANVVPRYRGPLGVDLMLCADGSVHVAEINFRHTMGMVAHEQIVGTRRAVSAENR